MRLRFALFGQVQAWYDDDEIVLGPAHRRTVLAVLALRANQVVTRSELIDAVWGEHPPASANGSIYTYVSALRKALTPRDPEAHAVLESNATGYLLRVPDEAIDIARFEALREEARRRYRNSDPLGAIAALDDALDLYRGEPLADLPGPFAAAQRERLKELRLDTVEQRARALVDVGEHARVAADLSDVASRHPMRENLQDLLLLSLYRSGRRDEALEVFESVRAITIEQLGTEPGSALTTRYDQIRSDDPALWPAETNDSSGLARLRPGVFVGRDTELAHLRSAITGVEHGHGGVIWIEGGAGVGKSALVAEALTDARCPVGIGVADEFSSASPFRLMLSCLGVRHAAPDPRRALLARALKGPRDPDHPADVASIVELVRELCAQAPLILFADDLHWMDSASLSVWRELVRLTADSPLLLIGAHRPLPSGAGLAELRDQTGETRRLRELSEDEASELLAVLIGPSPEPAVAEFAATAAGNPRFLTDLVDAWQTHGALAEPDGDGRPALPVSAAQVIKRRLAFLPARAQEALRWAALFDPEFPTRDLAMVLDLPATEAERLVDELVDAGLLRRDGQRLGFRHPVVRQAFHATMPQAIRLALHRQLAEILDAAGTPAEHVAGFLAAAPVPVDTWVREWVLRNGHALAPSSPKVALRLVRRVSSAPDTTDDDRSRLEGVHRGLLRWLAEDGSGTPAPEIPPQRISTGAYLADAARGRLADRLPPELACRPEPQ
ncbi:BTAD domain-containing putative transcriptional regulator [Amycolatopsis sp. WAC 04197]|uniref:BTAD domain-containing putative transcriptional regulator n=1 Tax=Amycolatopsis sp. WAC 04197 TaxID=2203199 RepID=UPI0013151D23|nr:BTAD domain-containing putative transcriptional regulator [Amycolatopsis sp. WAC 04197]